MDTKIINIGDSSYRCKIAESAEDKKQGLMDITFLPPDEGMLFKFSKDEPAVMWMKNTKIPLDQIGIDSEDVVTKVHTADPEDDTLIEFPGAVWILEVNAGSNIHVGDDFEFDTGESQDKYVMRIIGSDGGTQFQLQGGERICSRISTRQLIKWAKKAEENKDNPILFERYCKRLGKRMFRELYDQDHRASQYVQTPKED